MTTLDPCRINLLPHRGDLRSRDVEENMRQLTEAIRCLADDRNSAIGGGGQEGVPTAAPIGQYKETFTATGAKTVTHQLGSHVQVSVFDSLGVRLQTIVNYIDDSTVTLKFNGTLTNAVVVVDVGVST